jgi:ATP-binding cassette subfamily B protein
MNTTPKAANVYLYYLQYLRCQKGKLALATICLLVSVVMHLARPWPLKVIFDYVLMPEASRAAGLDFLRDHSRATVLGLACAGLILFSLLYGLFEYWHRLTAAGVGQRVIFTVRGRLYAHIQRLSLGFHTRNKSGDLLNRLMREVNQFRDFLTDSGLQLIGEVLLVTGMIAVLLALDWRLTVASVVLFPLLMICIVRFSSRIRWLTRKRLEQEGKVASLFNESLAAIQVVQLFSGESRETLRFQEENRRSYKAELRSLRLKNQLLGMVEVASATGTCLVLWWGTKQVLGGNLSPGDLLIFISYLKNVYRPIKRVAALTLQASRALASAERVMQILLTEPEIRDAPNAIRAPRFRGAVEFRDVVFGYEPGRPVLHRLNLRVEPGQKTALTGLSGAGKSTLVSLIPRLYDPAEGSVLIDGVDIRNYTVASLREQISVVPQTPGLFGSSIRENIAYGDPSADLKQIRRAARLAHAEEFITRLPGGYNAIIGERGAGLSGGERQRIAIARALLRDTPIVILDEPMTGLDIVSEDLLLKALENLLRDKTAFVIAHRFSTILKADLVVVLEAGSIVEMGTPSDLFHAQGRFRQLSDLQFGAGEWEKFLSSSAGRVQ